MRGGRPSADRTEFLGWALDLRPVDKSNWPGGRGGPPGSGSATRAGIVQRSADCCPPCKQAPLAPKTSLPRIAQSDSPADTQAQPAGTVASSHSSKVGPASSPSGPGRAAPFA